MQAHQAAGTIVMPETHATRILASVTSSHPPHREGLSASGYPIIVGSRLRPGQLDELINNPGFGDDHPRCNRSSIASRIFGRLKIS
jgi:hypothetical protein